MKKIFFYLIAIALLIVLFFIIIQKPSIKVGFAGTLSGKNAPLGIAVKDGVLLAVEKINEQGGIRGKKLELIVKDDQNDPKTVLQIDRELIDEGVCTIIGHVTSAMTKVALPLINERQMLLLSPTTSSFSVLEAKDNLISLHPPNIYEQEELAKYAIKQSKHLSIIYDIENEAFSQGWVTHFSDFFESIGGTIDAVYGFSDGENDLFKAANHLLEKNPPGVLMIASAIDTAKICQHIEKHAPGKVLKFSSGWSMNNALLEQGGKSINGLILPNSWDKNADTKDYLQFRETFKTRFEREPQFAETYGYETAMLLFEILNSGIKTEPMRIKDKILDVGEVQGLQGKMIIDEMGKTKRDVFLFVVEGNSFKRISN